MAGTRTELAALRSALAEPFGPHDPHKYARQSGAFAYAVVAAIQALFRDDKEYALQKLRKALEENDPLWADFIDEVEQRRRAA